MPNWCDNVLKLRHKDPRKIDLALLAFKDEKFCETFVPLPNGEWNYDFCVSNWGTKWEVGGQDGDCDRENLNTAVFCFNSAWAPPTGVYQALCAAGYEVEAFYNEPGMAYCGKIVGDEAGFDDDYIEYAGADSDTVRDIIGEELDDQFAISETMSEWEQTNEDIDEEVTEEELVDELERIRNIGPHTD